MLYKVTLGQGRRRAKNAWTFGLILACVDPLQHPGAPARLKFGQPGDGC